MLLYADQTIKHAGVVVGIARWADHLYKQASPTISWSETCFIPPSITRPVTALTGACMAVDRAKFDQLGRFDEDFQIVFSDVELCVRAQLSGLRNIYCGDVRMFHYESKTRSPQAVPDSDFQRARRLLEPYRTHQTDPYFHPHLDKFSLQPQSDMEPTSLSRWLLL